MLHHDVVQLLHELLVHLAGVDAVEMRQRGVGELLVRDVAVLEQAGDVGAQQLDREGLLDVAVGAHFQGLQAGLHAHGRGQQQHGQVAEFHVGLDVVAQLAAVHQRHHDVADHEVDALVLQLLHGILAVGGGDDVVFVGQFAGEVTPHLGGVLDDQQRVAAAVVVGACAFFFLRYRLRRTRVDLDGDLVLHGQFQHEGVAVADLEVQVEPSFMQAGQRAGEGEAEAGAFALAGGIPGLVEDFEDLLALLGRDHGAVAVHPQDGGLAVLGGLERDVDAVFGVFEAVGHQVADDLLHGVAYAHDLEAVLRQVHRQGDLLFAGVLGKRGADVAHDGGEVLLEEDGLDLVLLHLAQVEQLVGQRQEAVRVGLDRQQVLLRLGRVFPGRDQLVQRHLDKGQRGADLVRDVGEEVDLGVVDLFLLLRLQLAQVAGPVAAALHLQFVEEDAQQRQEEGQVADLGSGAPQERRHDVEFQVPDGVGGVRSEDAHVESVASGAQARETDRVAAGPGGQDLACAAAERVVVVDLLEDGEIGGGETDGQQGGVVLPDADPLGVDRGAVRLMQAQGPIFAGGLDVGDVERIAHHGFLHLGGVERRQAAGAAHVDHAVARGQARAVGELRAHDLLAAVEMVADLSGLPVDAVDAPRGGDPEDAVFVFHHGAGHVGAQPVGAADGTEPQVGQIRLGIRIADAAAFGGDPDAVLAVFEEGSDAVGGQSAVRRSGGQVLDGVAAAVAAKQAVSVGPDPEIAPAVLEEGLYIAAVAPVGFEDVLLRVIDIQPAGGSGIQAPVPGEDAAAAGGGQVVVLADLDRPSVETIDSAAEGVDPQIVPVDDQVLHVEPRDGLPGIAALPVGVQAVEPAVFGAEPDVAVRVVRDAVDDGTAHGACGRVGIVDHELILLVLPDIEPVVVGAHPHVAGLVLGQAGDVVGRQGVRIGAVADLGRLAVCHEDDEQAVACPDPVFARLPLQDVADTEPSAVENGRDREVDGLDEQDPAVRGRHEEAAVLSRLDVRQAVGEGDGVEAVAALVVVVQGAVAEDDPHGVVGVDGDLGGRAAREGVFLDLAVRLDVAVQLVAGHPDVALQVRLQVERQAASQPSERAGRPLERVVPAHAVAGGEPEQAVLVLADIHAREVGGAGDADLARAAELIAVETGQAVAGPDPDEAEPVLVGAVDGVGGKPLAEGIVLEIVIGSGGPERAAADSCQQQEEE